MYIGRHGGGGGDAIANGVFWGYWLYYEVMRIWNYGYILGLGLGLGWVGWDWVYMGFRRGHGHGHGVWDVTDDTPWIADHAGWRFCFLVFSDPTVSITGAVSSELTENPSMKILR